MAAFGRGLVGGKSSLDERAEEICEVGPVVSVHAGRQHQWAEVHWEFGLGNLTDPHEQVGRRAEDLQDKIWGFVGRVDGLPDEARDEAGTRLVGFVWDAVNAWGTAFRS